MSDSNDFLTTLSDPIPFDDFKVQGVIRRRRSIPVDDANAEYWTIIGYISGEQICGIGRFASRAEAEEQCRGFYRHGRSA
jgi:hypothetical protein